MHHQSVKVFSDPEEKFNLIFPVIGVLGTLAEIALAYHFSRYEKFFIVLAFSALFFSGGVHYMFTFALLKHFPPFKKLWALKKKSAVPVMAWMFGLIGLVVGLQYLSRFWTDLSTLAIGLFLIGNFADALFGRYHALRQHLGISLIYNAKRRQQALSVDDRELLEMSERWERRMYSLLILSQCAQFALFARIFRKDLVRIFPLAADPMVLKVLIALQVLLAAGVAAFIVVDRIYFRSPVNKCIFNVRLFLAPLTACSYSAYLFQRATHGIEYFLILRKMLNFSDRTVSRRIVGLSVVLGALIFFSVYVISSKNMLRTNTNFHLLCACIMFYGVSAIWHYYLDGVLFKMKDPVVRSIVGPLLTSEGDGAGVNIESRVVAGDILQPLNSEIPVFADPADKSLAA